MDEFPPNTNKGKDTKVAKPEKIEKNIEKVVSGEVKLLKKSFGARVKQVFLGGDAHTVTSYIVAEVLLPALRNLVVDATTQGVQQMVYGGKAEPRSMGGQGRPRVQYNSRSMASGRGPMFLPDQPPRGMARRHQEVNEVVLTSREEAAHVLENLNNVVDQFEAASVADLKELVGLPTSPVDFEWGWFNLSHSYVRQVRQGYLLDLPPVVALD